MKNISLTLRTLLEHSVHLGHHSKKWNPKMSMHLLGRRNNLDIINLEHTLVMLRRALNVVNTTVKEGGTVLFVSTNTTYARIIEDAANRAGQPYINKRLAGGTLTNYIQLSLQRKQMENNLRNVKAKRHYLDNLGLRQLTTLPSLIFVIGVKESSIILKEASKLQIPTIGVIDTNNDPNVVTYCIPGNDDSIQAAYLYANLVANAAVDGKNEI
uniref:Ribosomal protein S2 n=1 Tax=Seculamonas ecuadoriensis TaxID=221724 RepID=M4QAT7_SECEC|nr:ribosomal protein S2 [Seculamonas ecuadoriensis]AGH24487.1 ribosomal protein S2 [Seculamonas ecuadoriensis]